MYPRVERGKQVLMPEYNAFSDPHLQNYYRKKFAGPPAIEPCKKSTLRVRNILVQRDTRLDVTLPIQYP